MKTKILLFIGLGIIIVGLGVGGYFFLIPRCPESCDDGNSCTQDICSEETNYKCSHPAIPNCCGNKICESGENYGTCPVDCPNCDDNNTCTKDSYDYHEQKCVNAPILTVVCCGNTVCEIGETYGNCARDCPSCDDDNKCTKDKYDYHKQKCISDIIVPCCGNGMCDKGAETYSNCFVDCPNCNDNNRLTTDSFNYTTQKCENIVTHYFIDDFESGTKNWSFSDNEGRPVTTGLYTKLEGNNAVLRGTGFYWAYLEQGPWTNYIFKTKFKIVRNDMHFNYRIRHGQDFSRYFIGVGSGHLCFSKQIGEEFFNLTPECQNPRLDEGWHTFEIRGYGNILNIYIDNKLLIKYKDTQNPVLSGGVAFEIFDKTEFLIDDVEIKVIAEKDITYP